MKKILIAALLAGIAGSAPAQNGGASFLVQETGQGFGRLQDAIDAIGGGVGTIMIAPGRYRQCAIQEAGQITFAAAEPGTAIFDGVTCEGKAALVLRGQSASINGLTFQNLSVPDGNGAGIRLEQGNLDVAETLFRDSQSGILSHNDPEATIHIQRSTFSGLGYCGDDCAHSIYIGNYGRLIVEKTRFERGTGGHYIKTRGALVDVHNSSFDDSAGQATNYMIDLPNGATGRIADNIFVQGVGKENYTAMIVVAAEEIVHPSRGLSVRGNRATLAPGAKPTAFLVDFSHEPLASDANRLGSGIAAFETR